MISLFHRITKDLTVPLKKRSIEQDEDGMASTFPRAQVFECSEVRQLAFDLAWKFQKENKTPGHLAFLPAPITWIEFDSGHYEDGPRWDGYLIVERDNGSSADFYYAQDWIDDGFYLIFGRKGSLALFRSDSEEPPSWKDTLHEDLDKFIAEGQNPGFTPGEILDTGAFVAACLALINSPHVVGQRTLPPHKGLEKKLRDARIVTAMHPLHAWTEIVLDVNPQGFDGAKVSTGRMSGARALHFCRKHVRIRNGKLELVSSHWRGDAAKGVKRSRYRVKNEQ